MSVGTLGSWTSQLAPWSSRIKRLALCFGFRGVGECKLVWGVDSGFLVAELELGRGFVTDLGVSNKSRNRGGICRAGKLRTSCRMGVGLLKEWPESYR